MQVLEGQRLGALTILIASLGVYGGDLLCRQRPIEELSLPWVNQGPGTMAAEVTGSRAADGIYFLPQGTVIARIPRIIGVEGRIDDAFFVLPGGSAISITSLGGVLTIGDMPAMRRLALGVPIDVNHASVEDLSLVPGIGERMAIEIIRRRQAVGKFEVLSDLTDVPGIKDRKLNGVKKFLTVESTF
jgi:hypothetical protein